MSKQLIFTAIIILGSFAVKAQGKKVAVFDPAGDVANSIKEVVREEISAAIVNTAEYTVLERSLINKVLEENKFQAGGLVDDSQVSEMGKRMGANYVFVTSVTKLGKNLYISCKMIEVLTARIDKQKTARTVRGDSDLIDIVKKLMSEMFVPTTPNVTQNTAVKPKEQPEVSKKIEYQEAPTDLLITNGKRIYQKNKKMKKYEVRHLMTNTQALNFYEKGLNQRKWGNGLIWSGVSSIAIGVFFLIDEEFISIFDLMELGAVFIPLGAVEVTSGIVLKSLAKKNTYKSVRIYNNPNQTTQVRYNFGITPNGIGLTINF